METPNDKNKRLLNEIEEKKQQLENEFGKGIYYRSEESDLPPEIESQFLDSIMNFEKTWKNAKQITVFEFLGNPLFRQVDELTDAEIPVELERLSGLMNEKQVGLDTLCEVPDRELYRFITEELFQHEIDDMRIPGMMTNYIYEEFHPNHEYDIRKHASEFMRSYLDKESSYYTTFLSEDATKSDWHKHFREAFGSFDLEKFEITGLQFDPDAGLAQVGFDADFTGFVEGVRDRIRYTGKGTIRMVYQWDFWCVELIQLPESV